MANNGKVATTKDKAEPLQEQLLQRHDSDGHENVIQARQRKIGLVTEGLDRYLRTQLTEQVVPENANIIGDYILAQKTEKNISDNYRASIISGLIMLCKFHKNKPFLQFTRDDVISYLDSYRKPESVDPLHKWIGTYNLKRDQVAKFFKWLYYPNITSKERSVPPPIENIPILKRKEQSIYKPSDLWSLDDDRLFLKYCHNIRDKCYHAISRDASARPNEILGLKGGVKKWRINSSKYLQRLMLRV